MEFFNQTKVKYKIRVFGFGVMSFTLLIYYCSWGGNPKDSWLWTGELEETNEIVDYNSKEELKRIAKENNWNYKVLKLNRKTRKMEVVEEKTSVNY